MPKTAQAHTPGPWISVRSPDHRTIAEVICQLPEETEANARLIAAAPDLLEAARQALTALQNVRLAIHETSGTVNSPRHYEDLVTPAVRDLQAAIAKAERGGP